MQERLSGPFSKTGISERPVALASCSPQTWADTFISELNDTHVEAELRTKNIPPAVRAAVRTLSSALAHMPHS